MDGDALHFVRANFDLAGMQAAADLNAERVNRLADGLSALLSLVGVWFRLPLWVLGIFKFFLLIS